jgi:hypothetical protein
MALREEKGTERQRQRVRERKIDIEREIREMRARYTGAPDAPQMHRYWSRDLDSHVIPPPSLLAACASLFSNPLIA